MGVIEKRKRKETKHDQRDLERVADEDIFGRIERDWENTIGTCIDSSAANEREIEIDRQIERGIERERGRESVCVCVRVRQTGSDRESE